MRRLVVASMLVILAIGPAQAASSPAPAASAKPSAKPSPVPSASPTPRTFLGLQTGNRAVAASMSLVLNGLGQFYNGDDEKGRYMMAPMLLFPVAWGFDALTGGAYMRVFAYAVNLGIKPWSMYDAYQGAVPSPSPVPSAVPSRAPSPSPAPSKAPSPTPSLSPVPSPAASR